jgi:hypothetical protein
MEAIFETWGTKREKYENIKTKSEINKSHFQIHLLHFHDFLPKTLDQVFFMKLDSNL